MHQARPAAFPTGIQIGKQKLLDQVSSFSTQKLINRVSCVLNEETYFKEHKFLHWRLV